MWVDFLLPLALRHHRAYFLHPGHVPARSYTFSSPEAALLLVSTKNRDPLAKSNTGSLRLTDFPSLCACSESSLTNLIGSGLNLLCLQIHSKTECRWTGPEIAILGADQKESGLWGREWVLQCLLSVGRRVPVTY